MKFVTVPVVAAVLGFSLGTAQAFQETQLGTAAPPSAPAQATEPRGLAPAPQGMLLTPTQKKAAEETDRPGITIPGLGSFGLLPKMNFGLELLYGEGETREPVAKPQEAPIDDLMIRGSVKHNF